MAEVFVLGGGTPTPTEFRPGSPKTVNHQTRYPRNHVPKFQAKFGVAEEEVHGPRDTRKPPGSPPGGIFMPTNQGDCLIRPVRRIKLIGIISSLQRSTTWKNLLTSMDSSWR